MSQRMTHNLPSTLLQILREGRPALLLTVDLDGFPHTAFTWAVALDAAHLRFAADYGSVTLTNLEREARVALQIIGLDNLVFLVKGVTHLVKPQIEAAPFSVAMMDLAVSEVKDQSWPGVSVQPFGYEWPAEQRESMLAMEQAVYVEMRTWPG
jgi:hypothetical protein